MIGTNKQKKTGDRINGIHRKIILKNLSNEAKNARGYGRKTESSDSL